MISLKGDDVLDFLDVLAGDFPDGDDRLFFLFAFHRFLFLVFHRQRFGVEGFQRAGQPAVVPQLELDGFAQVLPVLPFHLEGVADAGARYRQFKILFVPVEATFDFPADFDAGLDVHALQGVCENLDDVVLADFQVDQEQLPAFQYRLRNGFDVFNVHVTVSFFRAGRQKEEGTCRPLSLAVQLNLTQK